MENGFLIVAFTGRDELLHISLIHPRNLNMVTLPTNPSVTKPKMHNKRDVKVHEELVEVLSKMEESPALHQDDSVDESSAENTPSSKKRKRDIAPASELEIDVSLPEPPSKKALRKAKKQKTTGASTTTSKDASGGHLQGSGNDDLLPSDAVVSTPALPADARSPYGIWIGNLPFIATKPLLRAFLTSPETGAAIKDSQITRVHMPAPQNAAATRTQLKPLNKGFAYVDFSTKEALDAALALSESMMGGRKVLIKDSKSFVGRPDKVAGEGGAEGAGNKDVGGKGNSKTMKPTKRVFVGNLGFDVTKEDLKEHYEKCGEIADIHMATFEDSGKCKGFAWVTFDNLEAAECAVQGWVRIPEPADDDEDESEVEDAKTKEDGGVAVDGKTDSVEDGAQKTKSTTKKPKKQKTRKWFVNRLQGRPLRSEYAEDASSRYKKRFGKEAPASGQRPGNEELPEVQVSATRPSEGRVRKKDPASNADIQPGAPSDRTKRRGKVAGEADLSYRTGAIVESAGTKVTF